MTAVVRLPTPLLFIPLLALGACLVACLGQHQATPQTMPHDAALRRDSLSMLGQSLFEGLRAGTLDQSFASMRELDAIVAPEARMRLDRERASSIERAASLALFRNDWRGASYAGFCAQGAREEQAHASLGLTQPGWVLERILVVARTGATSSASWLEGDFVYTAQGWKALNVRRVEAPRRQHADLELAPCDVEAGLR
jgi:hypothetical protein